MRHFAILCGSLVASCGAEPATVLDFEFCEPVQQAAVIGWDSGVVHTRAADCGTPLCQSESFSACSSAPAAEFGVMGTAGAVCVVLPVCGEFSWAVDHEARSAELVPIVADLGGERGSQFVLWGLPSGTWRVSFDGQVEHARVAGAPTGG